MLTAYVHRLQLKRKNVIIETFKLVKCNMWLVDVTRNHFRVLVCRSQKLTLAYGYLQQNREQIIGYRGPQVMHRGLETCLGNRIPVGVQAA